MLQITIPSGEFFNEDTGEFIHVKSQKITLEHSLLSISKWEATWKKPFLSDDQKSPEEYLDYIRCMTITPNVDPMIYNFLDEPTITKIRDYIEDPHTATTIKTADNMRRGRKRIITSELIYYWMVANRIPTEYEKWHLNRLMTLLRICSIENDPKKNKMGRNAILRQNAELNAQRRAKYHTKG